jgi:Protein of unknown function (DUF721).
MQRENVKKIADVIADYVQEDNMGEGLLRSRIFAAWDLIIADRTSAHLSPDAAAKLTARRSFKDGVLTCRMSSSVVRTQLQFQSAQLKEKLNSLLEGQYVDKIILL